jgi:hypothetical protein
VRYWLNVVWIRASTISTQVVEYESSRNFPSQQSVSKYVGACTMLACGSKDPVAIVIDCREPNPAWPKFRAIEWQKTVLIYLHPKTFLNRLPWIYSSWHCLNLSGPAEPSESLREFSCGFGLTGPNLLFDLQLQFRAQLLEILKILRLHAPPDALVLPGLELLRVHISKVLRHLDVLKVACDRELVPN